MSVPENHLETHKFVNPEKEAPSQMVNARLSGVYLEFWNFLRNEYGFSKSDLLKQGIRLLAFAFMQASNGHKISTEVIGPDGKVMKVDDLLAFLKLDARADPADRAIQS